MNDAVRGSGGGTGNCSSRGSRLMLLLLLLLSRDRGRHVMGVSGSGGGGYVTRVDELHSRGGGGGGSRRLGLRRPGVQNRPLRRSDGRTGGQRRGDTRRRLLRGSLGRSPLSGYSARVIQMRMVNRHQVWKNGGRESLLLTLMNDWKLVGRRGMRGWNNAGGAGRGGTDDAGRVTLLRRI